MKKLLLMAALGISALLASPAKAQVHVNINIGAQPDWGPAGYSHVDYYYLPEIESYYYVPTRKFIVFNGSRWVHSSYLPARYRTYNLHRARKIVINSPRPYLQHRNYRSQYGYASYHPGRQNYSSKTSYRTVNRHTYRPANVRHEGTRNKGNHGNRAAHSERHGKAGHGRH